MLQRVKAKGAAPVIWLVVILIGVLAWVWVWADWKHLKETNQGTFPVPMEKWILIGVSGLIAMFVGCIGFAGNEL